MNIKPMSKPKTMINTIMQTNYCRKFKHQELCAIRVARMCIYADSDGNSELHLKILSSFSKPDTLTN